MKKVSLFLTVLATLGICAGFGWQTAAWAGPPTGPRLSADANPVLPGLDGAGPAAAVGVVKNDRRLVSMIVILEDAPLASYGGGLPGLQATSPEVTGEARVNLRSPSGVDYLAHLEEKHRVFQSALQAAVPSAQVLNSYKVVLNGTSVLLPVEKVELLRQLPGVRAVTADEMLQPQTERSPRFIKATKYWKFVGGPAKAGEGVVVGVIDSGIWPEHPSFSDPDPAGNAYPVPPGGPYDCTFGNTAFNPDDTPFTCNNKLVGAYEFLNTYKTVATLPSTEFDSARDSNGHGTHTASTAAGNHHVTSSIFGIPRGAVSGIAPRAHIVAYKALGPLGGTTSDLVAAIDQAVADGVDVINYSVGGGASNPYTDPDALAFFDAYAAGIFVATSAGNNGPHANTTGSPGNAPWITTVGASTEDRYFFSTITLSSSSAPNLVIRGISMTQGLSATPIEMAGGDGQCTDTMPTVTTGAIVVCDRGGFERTKKSFNAMNAGAGGMILRNVTPSDVASDNHYIPSVHVDAQPGGQIAAYLSANSNVMASFTGGTATAGPGDVMATFSSRGGTSYTTIKPDVTAPGVQILAGHTPLAHDGGPGGTGPHGELFQAIQGTSMSSPHVAGAAALIRQRNPKWTPALIRSALMSTAKTSVLKEDGTTAADPFDMGAGRIDMRRAILPGLGFHAAAADFMTYQNELWRVNLPSIYVPNMPGNLTVKRTAWNLLKTDMTWELSVKAPKDVRIVVPRKVTIPFRGKTTFPVQIWAPNVPLGEVRHATLFFKSGIILQHMPITIVRGTAAVALTKECSPTDVLLRKQTTCSLTAENMAFMDARVKVLDIVPPTLFLKRPSVEGARLLRPDWLFYKGVLGAATPPSAVVTPASSPFGYVSLAGLGVTPAPPPTDCDEGGYLMGGLNVEYFGQTYTDGIWSVNGTLELGQQSNRSSGNNRAMPDTDPPNNLLAPWWTDLDLCAGGNIYFGIVSDATRTWTVFEWEDVPRFNDPASSFTFQVWLQQGTSNIHFVYGSSAGSLVDGTTGAENGDGTRGATYYYNGTGASPWSSGDLKVITAPGAPGESHVISYKAYGAREGRWTNCGYTRSNVFEGMGIDCVQGTVSAP